MARSRCCAPSCRSRSMRRRSSRWAVASRARDSRNQLELTRELCAQGNVVHLGGRLRGHGLDHGTVALRRIELQTSDEGAVPAHVHAVLSPADRTTGRGDPRVTRRGVQRAALRPEDPDDEVVELLRLPGEPRPNHVDRVEAHRVHPTSHGPAAPHVGDPRHAHAGERRRDHGQLGAGLDRGASVQDDDHADKGDDHRDRRDGVRRRFGDDPLDVEQPVSQHGQRSTGDDGDHRATEEHGRGVVVVRTGERERSDDAGRDRDCPRHQPEQLSPPVANRSTPGDHEHDDRGKQTGREGVDRGGGEQPGDAAQCVDRERAGHPFEWRVQVCRPQESHDLERARHRQGHDWQASSGRWSGVGRRRELQHEREEGEPPDEAAVAERREEAVGRGVAVRGVQQLGVRVGEGAPRHGAREPEECPSRRLVRRATSDHDADEPARDQGHHGRGVGGADDRPDAPWLGGLGCEGAGEEGRRQRPGQRPSQEETRRPHAVIVAAIDRGGLRVSPDRRTSARTLPSALPVPKAGSRPASRPGTTTRSTPCPAQQRPAPPGSDRRGPPHGRPAQQRRHSSRSRSS